MTVHAKTFNTRINAGAPGMDGMMFARIEEQGLEAWLAGLRPELASVVAAGDLKPRKYGKRTFITQEEMKRFVASMRPG